MPKKITIGIDYGGKEIYVKEMPGTGYSIPKSGSIKDQQLVTHITKQGVKLPARYLVQEKNGY